MRRSCRRYRCTHKPPPRHLTHPLQPHTVIYFVQTLYKKHETVGTDTHGSRQNDIKLLSNKGVSIDMQRFPLTQKQSASNRTPREINRNLIFNLIRRRQPISRADLARLSGLQRSTISRS